MASGESVCEIAVSLPGTVLDSDPHNPAWRVAGRVIVRRRPRLGTSDEDQLLRQHCEPLAVRADYAVRDFLISL